ncbi:MAG: aminopeptidase P family protein [Planctomycetes bacterium]|nr:aminopeptidase P family protein [Planctomycetota bacterium]
MRQSPSIVNEKVDQAVALLEEFEIDVWLTFVRETTEAGDPVLPLILGQNLTWQSALIVTRSGDRIAIVGKYEDEAVKSTGAWNEVVPYVKGIRQPLVKTLTRLDPQMIAVNYSLDDVKSDGLTHGMFLLLNEHLAETVYGGRLVPADRIIRALRSRKTPSELERIRKAIAVTQQIFGEVSAFAQPGRTEMEIAEFMRGRAAACGAQTAWDANQCPIVTTGPDSMIGHGYPSAELSIHPGRIFHLDFGVMLDDYCADLQRAWYVPAEGETAPPDDVQRAFDTVVKAIHSAADALRPGVEGWRIDEIARTVVTDAGYPEYQHATGHHVGRAAHDGGGVLGPKWERYGRTPFYKIEPGNVLTLELGIENTGGRGYIGLEEMVLVTESGCEFISTPQTTLPLLEKA